MDAEPPPSVAVVSGSGRFINIQRQLFMCTFMLQPIWYLRCMCILIMLQCTVFIVSFSLGTAVKIEIALRIFTAS